MGMPVRRRSRLAVVALCALGAASACSSSTGPKSVTLAKVAGDAELALQGNPVNVPPAVKVTSGTKGVSGVTVQFTVQSGGGSATGTTSVTDANGVATAGSWTVQSGSNTMSAKVTAGATPGDSVVFSATGQGEQYQIEIQYIVPVNASRAAAVDSAVAHWQRIVFGAVTPIPLNVGAGSCGSNSPAINETVNSVLIFVELDSIDGPGKILGQSGPCFIRTQGRLPIVGIVQFDTADIGGLESSGQFPEVILHEFAHILGYGTIWGAGDLNLLVNPSQSGGTDPHFIGPQALAAFKAIGGGSYTGGLPVPVEDSGGPGTADGHWRERVFHTELMTGFLNPSVPNPLSIVTIASMGDMGYTVNYAAAEPYSQLFSERAGPAGAPIRLENDILRRPVYEVDATGKIMGVLKR